MTKLSEIIPLKYVKQSKALQEIYKDSGHVEYYPITIADVIDNAEMLFGNKLISMHLIELSNDIVSHYGKNYEYCSLILLQKCLDNRPINEISKYIIDNIK